VPGTKSTTADNGETLTPLAKGIKTDEDHDTRGCPHDECHGSLMLTNSENVVCTSCRCTPDGIYLPPTDGNGTSAFAGRNDRTPTWDHDTYDTSNKQRLAGGYEAVYDEDDENRPNGVGTEYTFDLTTL